MNETRSYHSQCAVGDFLFVFFGCYSIGATNSIEKINGRSVVDRIQTNWALIKLQSEIQPRRRTLACQIDDNEIAILGGVNSIGEVLVFNT